jgi:O-antigen/teichoic acid export membrane protein
VIVTSISSRIVIMASAVVIAGQGCGLVRVLWATLAIEAGSLIVQAIVACTVIKFCIQALVVEHNAIRALVSFGVFTWLKSAISVLFGYLDRLMVAAFLGADPLAFYVLCAQLTQVVPSVMGAGLNFVFPNFSARTAVGDWEECRRDYRKAATVAAGLAAGVSGTLIATAHIILTVWLGPAAAAKYSNLLIAMTIGNGLLAVSVVPHYTALAFGRSRELALMNLAAGLASGIVAFVLLHRVGLIGGGLARILAGLVSLLAFAIVTSVFKKFDLNISPENDTKSLAVGFAVDPR